MSPGPAPSCVVRRVDNITKSAQDNREYRGLELKNGLRVLLVSDPETDKSAAAMDVNVGHLMDPWELPGTAHFCEHMLFLGTSKYPVENEYGKFIAANAGNTNAFTATDHTNYHFDVKPDQLPGALDRFVQFFLSPQFTESATEREVCAVDSEHLNNLKNDGWRVLQVDRSMSKPGHDYGKFGTGSKVVPVKDTRILQMAFPIPDLTDEYKSQPSSYISHLIGHEGPGSLLSELKRLGWVTTLSAGGHTQGRGFGIFEIIVDLSPEGLLHTEDIVALTFNYIGMVRREGIQKWIFDEQREINNITFRFKDKTTPLMTAKGVAQDLQNRPFEDILSAKYLMSEYKPERYREIANLLVPENLMYRVVSKSFEGKPGNTHEPVYGTEMKIDDISTASMKRFHDALETSHPRMHIPERNEYIPDKFGLKSREAIKSEHPRMIHEDGWSRVWFKQDDEYKMPKAETKLALTTPVVAYDPCRSLLSSLWLWCLNDTLAEETYNAHLAGLRAQMDSGPFGVTLRVSGYDEKQALFMKHLMQRMTTFKIDPTRFAVLFDALRRALQNFSDSQPYSLSQHYAQLLLGDKVWSKEQLLAVCDSVKLEDVEAFPKEMFKAFHAELFVHGNSTEKEALELAKDITDVLRKATPGSRPLYWNEYSPRRECSLENGDEYVYRHLQKTHDVSCVEVLYQVGVQNTRDVAIVSLIEQILREPAFNTLRTNEQLGYIVWVGSRMSSGTLSLSVIVQGPKGPDLVDERIEAFIQKSREDLVAMTSEEFEEQVTGMITRLMERPKTLASRFKRFWNEIEVRHYDFACREDEVEILKQITKQDVIDLYDKKFVRDAPERKKLAIFVHGKNEGKEQVEKLQLEKAQNGLAKQKEIAYIGQLRQSLSMFGRPPAKLDVRPIGVDPLQKSSSTAVGDDAKNGQDHHKSKY